MAQAGYTPIQLYFSTTAAAVPVNTNLVNGELALNIQDEKLYFKNAAGTVKLLASNATSAPVTSFQTSLSGLTPSTATTGAVTLAGTLGTANGGTGLTSFTTNGVVHATSSSALATSNTLALIGTTLSVNGTNANISIDGGGAGGIGNVLGVVGTSYGYVGTNTSTPLVFNTGNTERMRLDTSGNLGIGTSSPTHQLDVTTTTSTNSIIAARNTTATDGGAQLRAGNPQNIFILATDSNGGGLSGTANASVLYSTSTTPIVFMPNGVEKLRIASAGQIGLSGANYGSSGQVLTSGGSGAAPTWATPSSGGVTSITAGSGISVSASTGAVTVSATGGAAGMVQLATQTVSGVSEVNFDNISATYTNYLLIFEGVYNSSASSVAFRMRYRYSGTTDTGSAYSYVENQSTGAAISGASGSMANNIPFNSNSPTVTAPGSAIFGVVNISTRLNTSGNSYIIRSQAFLQNPNGGGGSPFGGFPYTNWVSGGYQGSSSGNSTITGINLYFSSGGIIGKMTLYGLT